MNVYNLDWRIFSPMSHYLSTKSIIPDMGNLLWSCWPGESKKHPKQYKLLLLDCFPFQMLKVSAYWNAKHFRHRAQRIWDRSDLKASSLRTGFHCTRSHYASFQGRVATSSFIHLSCLWTTKIISTARYQSWHSYLNIQLDSRLVQQRGNDSCGNPLINSWD